MWFYLARGKKKTQQENVNIATAQITCVHIF